MSKLSSKSQITIPRDVLKAAGLSPGDDLTIRVVRPGVIEAARPADLVDRYAGIFGDDVYPPDYLEELRREWR